MKLIRWFISWLKFERCVCHRCYRANNHPGKHYINYRVED